MRRGRVNASIDVWTVSSQSQTPRHIVDKIKSGENNAGPTLTSAVSLRGVPLIRRPQTIVETMHRSECDRNLPITV